MKFFLGGTHYDGIFAGKNSKLLAHSKNILIFALPILGKNLISIA
jgi:hypothetical protein